MITYDGIEMYNIENKILNLHSFTQTVEKSEYYSSYIKYLLNEKHELVRIFISSKGWELIHATKEKALDFGKVFFKKRKKINKQRIILHTHL